MPLTDGLVLYLAFNESSGSTATDTAGGADATLFNSPTFGAGQFANAISMVGGSTQYGTGDDSALPAGTSDRTVALWVYTASPGADGGVFGYGALSADQSFGLQLINAGGDNYTLLVYGRVNDLSFSITLPSEEWHHLAVTYDGSDVSVYLDGSLEDTQSSPGGWSTTTGSAGYVIGAVMTGGGPAGLFSGAIDDLRVYDRILDPAEIVSLLTLSTTFELAIRERCRTFNALGAELRQLSNTGYDPYGSSLRTTHSALNAMQVSARSKVSTLNSLEKSLRSQSATLSLTITGAMRSRHSRFNAMGVSLRSVMRIFLGFAGSSKGRHRVANDADDRYELYRGVDAKADLDGSAWETFTSLPHETAALTPPVSGTRAYHFVLRKRNKWGLSSLNTVETIITLNTAGEPTSAAPSAPQQTSAEATAGGTVTLQSRYAYPLDGGRQADTWLLYLTYDGSEPDPDLDTPISVAMAKVDGVAKLTYVTAAQAEGTVVTALVRVRRSADPDVEDSIDVDSTNSLSVSATATLLGPAGDIAGGIYLGASQQIQD